MTKNKKKTTAQSLYELSIQDLQSAHLLYEFKIYNNAVFFLQQSVEKLIKAIGVFYNIISPNQLKKVNHFSASVYKLLIESVLKEDKKFRRKFNVTGAMKNGLDSYNRNLVESLKSFKGIENTGTEDLNLEELDHAIKMIIGDKPDESQNLNTLSQEMGERTFDILQNSEALNNYTLESEIDKIPIDESFKNELAELMEKKLKFAIANKTLLILDLIMNIHENSSRYPCDECGSSPIDSYDDTHPIIIRFSTLLDFVDGTISILKEFFDEEKTAANNG